MGTKGRRARGKRSHQNADGTCHDAWKPSKKAGRCVKKCVTGKVRRYSRCKKGGSFCAKKGSERRAECHRRTKD